MDLLIFHQFIEENFYSIEIYHVQELKRETLILCLSSPSHIPLYSLFIPSLPSRGNVVSYQGEAM